MAFHLAPFFRRQRSRLEEDAVRYADLADIVEAGQEAKVVQAGFGQSNRLAQAHRQVFKARGVPFGDEVPLVQRGGKGLEQGVPHAGAAPYFRPVHGVVRLFVDVDE